MMTTLYSILFVDGAIMFAKNQKNEVYIVFVLFK